jgi:hypothetical protein
VSIEFSLVIGKKPMGLVPSVVLGSKSPVDNWEDGLTVVTNRTKYAAAYAVFPSVVSNTQRRWGLYAFSTFSNKTSNLFNRIHYKLKTSL